MKRDITPVGRNRVRIAHKPEDASIHLRGLPAKVAAGKPLTDRERDLALVALLQHFGLA